MTLTIAISPQGHLLTEHTDEVLTPALSASAAKRIEAAWEAGDASLLLHLATEELRTPMPPPLAFARDLARQHIAQLCRMPNNGDAGPAAPCPPESELRTMILHAPPMTGLEYLSASVLTNWWTQLDVHVHEQAAQHPGGVRAFLHEKNPLWRLVGQVTFHLAENKRDAQHPFAFLATYASRLSAQGDIQHLPLSRALQEYAGTKNRAGLLALLTPIQRAAEQCDWVNRMLEGGAIYQPLAWSPKQAHQFLKDVPQLEAAGLIVRVPDWWKPQRPPRPQVSVRVGDRPGAQLGADAMLDFAVDVTLDGEELSEEELEQLIASSAGLVRLRGQWVEVEPDKLAEALAQWQEVEREARDGGLSFFEGMRLLAGAELPTDNAAAIDDTARQWVGITAGKTLTQTLARLRDPQEDAAPPPDLQATLRPYQQTGVQWLVFMMQLGLGACLADDMGLGKTIQVIAALLRLRDDTDVGKSRRSPSLLIVPASLIANWRAEIDRFAPTLKVLVAHPSEATIDLQSAKAIKRATGDSDLTITSYGMLLRLDALRDRRWRLVILDEAQAIKNASARQTRTVKKIESDARIALTGTPIENRLGDLWSLFDFLNPGLLGNAKAFGGFVKTLTQREPPDFTPLRSLVQPYILRRLKTDKRVIADLPEKTEVKTHCALTRQQAAMYEQTVRELARQLDEVEGIKRRGIVLAFLMRFKQICNHPAQWRGDGDYDPAHSGKFQRLAGLCEELAQRQEKALIFTQFREMTRPLADHLQTVFGRPGLVLHGATAVAKRRQMVDDFQRDAGPPFFVLSLKAGGTGLNLTAACHVMHFDRWWNPAVENQATDRAFRIGQQRNVLVHKFVCRGTIEERIDRMIEDKIGLSRDLLDADPGKMLTELSDRELMDLVALDVHKAVDA